MITIEDIYNIDNTDLYTFHDSIAVHSEYNISWREINYPESDSISWSDLSLLRTDLSINNTRVLNGLEMVKDQLKETDIFLIPKYMSYGDYDNSCMVERSNYKTFLKEYVEEKGIFTIHGGYGSSGIAISIRYLLDPDNEDKAQSIINVLNGLNDYPCIDDEDMSNMEYDAFVESLDSFAIRECNDLLAYQYLIEVYDYDSDKLKAVLLESNRNLNYPAYEIESGGSCYIDTKRLIEKVTLIQYIDCLIDWEFKGDLS